MLLTREADYALLCVLEIARNGHMGASEVARRHGVSPSFLANIVHSLAREGIALTRRGAGGGISLSRPPSAITVLEVVEAVQGPLVINACVACPQQCPRLDECPAHPVFRSAQDRLRTALDVTLDVVLAGGTARAGPVPGDDGAAPDEEGAAGLDGLLSGAVGDVP